METTERAIQLFRARAEEQGVMLTFGTPAHPPRSLTADALITRIASIGRRRRANLAPHNGLLSPVTLVNSEAPPP